MRTRAIIVSLALVAVMGVGAAPAEAVKHCRDVEDIGPTGMDPADGNRIRATEVSCKKARRMVKRHFSWVFKDDDGLYPIRQGSWTCYRYGRRFQLGTVCKASGGRRVRWVLGP